jgi:hypothetical protein
MKRLLLSLSAFFVISVSGNAQSCPGDVTPPQPGDALGAVLNNPIASQANPFVIQLNHLGLASFKADSGQYNPTTQTGAKMYLRGDATLGTSDVIFTTATDNCTTTAGYPRITASQTTFTCNDIGAPKLVVITYTDKNNNTVQRDLWVNVVDPSSPTVVTTPGTFNLDATGNLTITPAMAATLDGGSYSSYTNGNNVTTTGFCVANYTYTLNPSTFTCSDLGANTVSLTVTNPTNNQSSTGTVVVTIKDVTAPAITAPSAVTLYLDASGSATLPSTTATATDACGQPTITYSKSTFTCADLGANVVTATATDGSSNSSTASITVTVVDNIAPTATFNSSVSLGATGTVDLNATSSWYSVTENCSYTIQFVPGVLDCDDLFTTVSVAYTITDNSNNTTTGTTSLTVVDQVNPVASAKNITVYLGAQGNGQGSVSITAADVEDGSTDNCAIATSTVSPSVFTCSNLGTPVSVTLTVTDASGNSGTDQALVTVLDTVAPNTIGLNGQYVLYTNQLLNGEISVTANVLNPLSNDNCAIVSTVLRGTDSSLYYQPGKLINVFTCDDVNIPRSIVVYNFDASGNWSRDVVSVILIDNTPPVISVPNQSIYLDASGSASLIADNIVTASDECGIDTFYVSQTEFDCSDVGTLVTVSAFAMDNNGVTNSTSFTVTVQDTVAPALALNNATITLNLNALGTVSLPSVSSLVTTSDACGTVTLSPLATSFNCNNVGSNSVAITATDIHGNSRTKIQNVVIVDAIAPVIRAVSSITLNLSSSGTATLTTAAVETGIGSTDNCSITTRTFSKSTFGCSDVGTQTVTYTVKDQSNNISTHSISVTVRDLINPVAVAQNLTAYLNANGVATISAIAANNGSSDNCSIDSIYVTPSVFTCANIGANPATLKVWDPSGNSHTASFIVTVVDNIAPTLDLLANNDTIRLDDNGSAIVTVPGIIGDVLDNCSDPVSINVSYTNVCTGITLSGSSITLGCGDVSTLACAQSSTNPNGLRRFTVTATDDEGNSTVSSVDLFVLDLVAPDVYPKNVVLDLPNTYPATITVDADTYLPLATGTLLDPIGLDSATTDACGIDSKELLTAPSQINGVPSITYDCTDLGDNSYYLRATDVNDNRAAYEGRVTVRDIHAPVITANLLVTAYLDANGLYTYTTSAQIDQELVATMFDNTEDCGVTYSVDLTELNCDDIVWLGPTTAPTSTDVLTLSNWGTTDVTVSATDVAGNVGTAVATVRVIDNVPPTLIRDTIHLYINPATGFVSVQNQQPAILNSVSADNCELNPDRGGMSQTTFLCEDVGINQVAITMYDIYGNSQDEDFYVVVHDSVAPVAVAQNITVQLDATGNVSITPAQVDNGSSDECNLTLLRVTPSAFTCAEVGANTVWLVVTDDEGNLDSAQAVVTVEDNVDPVISTIAPITLYVDGDGAATLVASSYHSNVTEACEYDSEFDITDFDCSDIGSAIPVVFTVTDASGNAASVSTTVTVLDTIKPVADVKANVTAYLDANGTVTLTFADFDIASYDNCEFVASVTVPTFTCSDVNQSVTATGTLTDPSGNVRNWSSNVTVRDTIGPVFATAQGDTVLYAVQYDCFALAQWNRPTFNANDQNCPGQIDHYFQLLNSNGVYGTVSLGSPVPVGEWTVRTVAEDSEGNRSYANFNLTVIDSTLPNMTFLNNPTIALGANGQTVITPAMLVNSSYDNCGIDTVTFSPSTVGCSDLGSQSIVVTVKDFNDNVRTYAVAATVADQTAPVVGIKTATVTKALSATGTLSITPADVVSSLVDNCTDSADVVLTLSPSTLDCSDKGSVTVVITATDASGNVSTATKTIQVVDNIAPVLSAPAALTLALDATGNVSLPASTATATDACGPVSLSYSNTQFTCSSKGANTVVVTAVDGSGNTSTDTMVVTIVDNTAPSVTMVSTPVVLSLDVNGEATLNTTQVVAASSDNCGITSMTVSPAAFDCTMLGNNSVTVTAVDASGNVTTASMTVSVVDQMAPVMTVAPAAYVIALDANGAGTVDVASIVASTVDNCTATPTVSISPASVSCSDLGSVTVVATAVDASGNTSTISKTIQVVDNIDPVITAPSSLTMYLDATGAAVLPSATASATDNCAPVTIAYSNTVFTCANVGTGNTVVVTATDASGNDATHSIAVTVLDTAKPIVTLVSTPVVVSLDAAGSASLSTTQVVANATDNCGIASMTVTPNTFSCADLGTKTVTIVTTDASGNTRTRSMTITVVDQIAPTIAVNATPYVVTLSATGSATLSVASIGSASDNCTASPSLTISPATVSCADLGSVTVVATAVDASGNVSTASKTIQVIDATAPVITAPSALTLNLDATGSAVLPSNTATAADACGPITLTYSKTVFTCANTGTNTVTVTAVDGSGNVSTSTITVTIADVTAPTLTLVSGPVTVALDANGSGTVNTAQVVSNAVDNCAITSLTLSPATFGCANLGANTVTVTATDAAGNTTTQTITVTVVDNIAPTIQTVTTPVTVSLGNNGVGTLTSAQVVAQVTDNCTSSPTVTISPTTFTCADLGVQTVTIFAADASGNISTTTVNITVVDAIAPVITSAPSNVVLPACNAVLNYAYQVTDNCSYTATMTSGYASGALFPVGTTTVTWEFVDPSGNATQHSFTVQVDPLGTYTLPTFDEMCLNEPITDLVNGQTGLVFSGAGVVANGTAYYPSNAGVGTHTLTYTYTDGNGCVQTGNFVMTVLPLPAKPVVLQLTPTTLSSSVTGAAYQWYQNGAAIAGATGQNLQITGGGNYEVEVFNASGCSRKSNGFVISANGIGLEEELASVRYYPNPTNSAITFEAMFEVSEDVVITIIDMRGSVVYEGLMPKGERTHQVDLSKWASAPYQVRFMSKDGSVNSVARIVKID